MNLIVAGKADPKDSLYFRLVKDEDGDINIEVSKDAAFNTPEELAYFSEQDGRVRLIRFQVNVAYRDVLDLTDEGVLEVE